jgi:hypothetical protein
MGYVDYTSTGMLAGGFCGFAGKRSDWSDTQTITIGETTSTNQPMQSTPTPTQTDAVLGLNWEQTIIATMGITIVGLAAALVFSRKRKPNENETGHH